MSTSSGGALACKTSGATTGFELVLEIIQGTVSGGMGDGAGFGDIAGGILDSSDAGAQAREW